VLSTSSAAAAGRNIRNGDATAVFGVRGHLTLIKITNVLATILLYFRYYKYYISKGGDTGTNIIQKISASDLPFPIWQPPASSSLGDQQQTKISSSRPISLQSNVVIPDSGIYGQECAQ
jgi:hypothetical protein